MNVFEISTRPPNTYLFNSTNSNMHHNGTNTNHYHPLSNSYGHHYSPHLYPVYTSQQSTTPSAQHQSRRTNFVTTIPSTTSSSEPLISLKQRSSSMNAATPNSNNTNGQAAARNLVTTAHIRYNGNNNINNSHYNDQNNNNNYNLNLKNFNTTNTNSTPSSPHMSNLNRSMSGKFVARVIATNNNSNNNNNSNGTANTANCNSLHHRIESPSPRARITSNLSASSSAYSRPSTHSEYHHHFPSDPVVATATVLPVYYEKDTVVTTTQLPVLKIPQLSRTGSLISNSANSGVGSATAVITINNNPSNNYQTMSSSSFFNNNNNSSTLNNQPQPNSNITSSFASSSPSRLARMYQNNMAYYNTNLDDTHLQNKLSNKPYSVIKGIKDIKVKHDPPQPTQPSLQQSVLMNNNSYRSREREPPLDMASPLQQNSANSAKKISSSFNQFLNSNRIMSQLMQKTASGTSTGSSEPSNSTSSSSSSNSTNSTIPSQKSILVNRKKFAYPPSPGQASPPTPYIPKKTVTFAN